jgi:restriction system protein
MVSLARGVKGGIQGILVLVLAIILLVILIIVMFPFEVFAIVSSILVVYFFRKYESEIKFYGAMKRFNINSLDALSGIQFENFLEKLLRTLGYNAKVVGKAGDQGADLIVETNQDKIIVQAKRYSKKVNNKAVQEAVTAKAIYGANKAWVITTNYFQDSAKTAASANYVKLTDRDELNQMIKDAYSHGMVTDFPKKGLEKLMTNGGVFAFASITIIIAIISIIVSFESTFDAVLS